MSAMAWGFLLFRMSLLTLIGLTLGGLANAEEIGEPLITADEHPPPIVASLNEQNIVLSIHRDALDRVFLVQLNGTGRSLYAWRATRGRIELYQPVIESTLGVEHRVGERYPYFIAAHALPVVVATFYDVEIEKDRFVFDATNLFMGKTEGFPSPNTASLGDQAEISDLYDIGTSDFDKGTEIWATARIETTNRRSFENWPQYVGDRLDLRAHWTIRYLPEQLLEGRRYDRRYGFMAVNRQRVIPPSLAQEPIRRWRLADLSEQDLERDSFGKIWVYLSADVPEKWRGSITAGLLSWAGAFEEAGFPDAIEVREEPLDERRLKMRSGRYNVVDWIPTRLSEVGRERAWMPVGIGIETSYDLRSGEILNFRIPVSWPADKFLNYFAVACGPALGYGLSTKEIKRRIAPLYLEAMIAHEFGHALGLVDGNFGEGTYKTKDLREEEWLSAYGFTPSVMNYSRCNYVAQPEDEIDPRYLVPRVGPADIHQIKWGYGERADAPELLDQQRQKAYLRFTSFNGPRGISTFNEAVDVSDPLEATRLGLKNVSRSSDRINEELRTGSISDAEALLLQYVAIDLWATMLEHASTVIGGAQLYGGHPQIGEQSSVADRLDQIDATAEFILSNITAPTCDPVFSELVAQPESNHVDEFCLNMRTNLATSLLEPNRLNALAERDIGGWDVELLEEYLIQILQIVFPEISRKARSVAPSEFGIRLAIAEKMRDVVTGSVYTYVRDERSSFYQPSMRSFQGAKKARPEVRAVIQTRFVELCKSIEWNVKRSESVPYQEHLHELLVFCS